MRGGVHGTDNVGIFADDPDLDSGIAALNSDTWYHFVMKTNGTDGSFYLTMQGDALDAPTTAVGSYEMDEFYIGINRGLLKTWEGDYANIAIYNTALNNAELNTLLSAGPSAIPEPSSAAALFGLAGIAMILRRRK